MIVIISVSSSFFLLFPSNLGTPTVTITIGTTTSVYATGLLDSLIQEFKKEYPNISIKTFSVGTGQALVLAERGEADIVIVHAPSAEKKFIDKGVLLNGYIFAYNSFIIVGPKDDPANIKGKDELEAFKAIFYAGEQGKTKFVSRGDDSGTHKRELSIWKKLNLKPFKKAWYLESGTGMDITLSIANEKIAYTLSDIGSYLFLKENLKNLDLLVDKGDNLLNIYSIYLVKGYKDKAKLFYDFVRSEKGGRILERFHPLFLKSFDGVEMAWERLSKEL
ncbi:MAG: substrate-binding domain-containing protein [Nitrososphaerales archaeon]